MAIAIRQDRRRVTHRPPWVRQRGAEPESALTVLMLMLLIGGVVSLVASTQLLPSTPTFRLGALSQRAEPVRPLDGAVPENVAVPAATAEPPLTALSDSVPVGAEDAPTQPAPTQPELVIGGSARVANTEGLGVVLRTAPRSDARLPAGLLEGTTVTVLERSGTEWARVQTEAKRTGWVPVAFLAPQV